MQENYQDIVLGYHKSNMQRISFSAKNKDDDLFLTDFKHHEMRYKSGKDSFKTFEEYLLMSAYIGGNPKSELWLNKYYPEWQNAAKELIKEKGIHW